MNMSHGHWNPYDALQFIISTCWDVQQSLVFQIVFDSLVKDDFFITSWKNSWFAWNKFWRFFFFPPSQNKFPTIVVVAQHILGILAYQIKIECIFFIVGILISFQQFHLQINNMDKVWRCSLGIFPHPCSYFLMRRWRTSNPQSQTSTHK